MRIGLLEDVPELCAMFKEMLGNSGHAVSIYRDGLDILAALHLEEPTTLISPFDILLVDLILPGVIDGVQVIQQVRMKYPDLPIVVISAVASAEEAERYSSTQPSNSLKIGLVSSLSLLGL